MTTTTGSAGPELALRVAFLAGSDSAATRRSIEAVCRIPGIVPAAVLLDVARPSGKQRRRNLQRNLQREGAGYLFGRAVQAVGAWLDARAARIVPRADVDALVRAAFPCRSFTLPDLAARYGFAVVEVNNLNSAAAASAMRDSGAELGIVLGTRVLKRSTFAVPERGCINLHKGRVPEYRGMPPGFWELYEGAESAGVTVHFVDDGLDTGDIIGEGTVPIEPTETVASLRAKLDIEGARVLAESVAALANGIAQPRPQPAGGRTHTKPTRAQQAELAARAPHLRPVESELRRVIKTALYLALFHSGVWARVQRSRQDRGIIMLHHRVNDVSTDDPLTTSPLVFAEQLLMLKRHYCPVSTTAIVERVRAGRPLEGGTVAIHFDDCYRDVYEEAAPLLRAAGIPATMFIATGFVDTDRVFEHDRTKSPHRFANLRRGDIPGLLACGLEVGAHTVNHVDLGRIDAGQAFEEVSGSKRDLEQMSGRKVTLFSFPFGRQDNFREEVREMVRRAGYSALFSAHGGAVSSRSDPYDIPRIGVNSRYRALELMMEIEGLSVAQLFRRSKPKAGANS